MAATLRCPAGTAEWQIEAVSVTAEPTNQGISAAGDSRALAITPDGTFVLFSSSANNLVANDHSPGFVSLFLKCRTNGLVSLVSVKAGGGGGGNGDSGYAAVTPDGRYVAFESFANDLVTNDQNEASDVFVRDMAAGTTKLVSLNQSGTGTGSGASSSPAITPDGRYVAFISAATNLVTGDINRIPDVFVRDLETGITTLVSAGAKGYPSGSATMDSPIITADGRFVAYASTAINLAPGVPSTNRYSEVYVWERVSGRTVWASSNVANRPLPFDYSSYSPILSEDGHYLAFKTSANGKFLIHRRNLANGALELISANATGVSPGTPDSFGPEMSPNGRFVAFVGTNGSYGVWLWNARNRTSTLVSADLAGQPGRGSWYGRLALSPNGRYVAFVSDGLNLVTNSLKDKWQVYVRDMRSGVTRLATADPQGAGSGSAETAFPCLADGGSLVLFDSPSDTLLAGDKNGAWDVFVRDMRAEATGLISQADPKTPPLTGNAHSAFTGSPLSADGRYVVFESSASDLVLGDTNGLMDVFLRDRQTGTNQLLSINRTGTGSANGASYGPSISADGRYVAFTSTANNLVANDTNTMADIFLRDLLAGTTTLVTVSTNDRSANQPSSSPSLSADGRRVAFESQANNLAAGDRDGFLEDIFVRDLAAGTTLLVSTNYPSDSTTTRFTRPVISPDGRFVAFQVSGALSVTVRIKDLQGGSQAVVSGLTPAAMAFSGNSQVFAAFCTNTSSSQLIVTNLIQRSFAGLNGAPARANSHALSLSFDGRWVAFSGSGYVAGDNNNVEDVFLYDSATANLRVVSTSQVGTTRPGNGPSYWPRISADGRYVAFRSAATDLVPGDFNRGNDLFLYDRLTGQKTLLSLSLENPSTANRMSLGLAMTPDGRRVVFNSAASDLVNGDYNGGLDVFTVGLQPGIAGGLELADAQWLWDDISADSDGDGLTDAAEFLAGTDPADPASVLKLTGVTRAEGMAQLRWNAVPGRSYRVQYKNSLSEPVWSDVPAPVRVVGSQASAVDSTAPASQRFYRILLQE